MFSDNLPRYNDMFLYNLSIKEKLEAYTNNHDPNNSRRNCSNLFKVSRPNDCHKRIYYCQSNKQFIEQFVVLYFDIWLIKLTPLQDVSIFCCNNFCLSVSFTLNEGVELSPSCSCCKYSLAMSCRSLIFKVASSNIRNSSLVSSGMPKLWITPPLEN